MWTKGTHASFWIGGEGKYYPVSEYNLTPRIKILASQMASVES